MNPLPYLADKFFNTPLALHPAKAEIVLAALAERLGVISLDNFTPRPGARAAQDEVDFKAPGELPEHAYEVVNGVAIIGVRGMLINKLGTLRSFSGITGYDGIRQNFLVAQEDPAVRAICLDIESPGGDVNGLFDLADTIYNARGNKPVHAILSEYAYSAAYAIASAADRITVPRTGGVGSIGVIVMHADLSKALAEGGIKITLITYGDRKGEGHPSKPLSARAREDVQAKVDYTGNLFAETVARNLSISKQRVINTQAGTFMGNEGVKMGLAHDVMSPDEAFRALVSKIQD